VLAADTRPLSIVDLLFHSDHFACLSFPVE
jgi:hypothetical protein